MKIIVLLVATFILSLSACAQKPALDTTLPWLQIKIWDYQSKPVSNPARSVIKTTYEDKPVYYVPPVCCDVPSELYAEDGKLICYPSGGITGNGDGKCPKFRIEYLDNKTNITDNKNTIVWEDKRKPIVSTRIIPVLH
jgi:hypothetical protein